MSFNIVVVIVVHFALLLFRLQKLPQHMDSHEIRSLLMTTISHKLWTNNCYNYFNTFCNVLGIEFSLLISKWILPSFHSHAIFFLANEHLSNILVCVFLTSGLWRRRKKHSLEMFIKFFFHKMERERKM